MIHANVLERKGLYNENVRHRVRFLVVIESSVLVVRTSHNGAKFLEDCGFLITPNIELLCHFPSAVGTHSMLPR